jgi:hypothetical protein
MLPYEIMKLVDQIKCGDVVLMDTFPASHGDQAQAAHNRATIMRHYVQYGFEGGFSAPLSNVDAPVGENFRHKYGLFATVAAITAAENDGPDRLLTASLPQYA